MYNTKDNIVALATTPSKSALNVVRCSGSGAISAYKKLTQTKTKPIPKYVSLKTVYFNGLPIDEMLIVYFRGPKSFTGEDVLEFSMHGGYVVVKRFMEAIGALGFRQAMPGEFSYRAFINGKIDLVQAEAIGSLVDSRGHLDSLYSINNIKGSLSKKIIEIEKKLLNIITYIEHELDFSENEIDFVDINKHLSAVESVVFEINKTIKNSFLSNQSKSQISVVLVGKTNVGKSSLFNRLLGKKRAIVTQIAGTTRDSLEAELVVSDTNVSLVDTAGIRKTAAKIEKAGITKTMSEIKRANIILFVDDKNPAIEAEKHKNMLIDKKTILIQSKVDLSLNKKKRGVIHTSAKKNLGISKLFTEISTHISKEVDDFKLNNLFLINQRQKDLFIKVAADLKKASLAGKESRDLVVFVSGLRQAYNGFSQLIAPSDHNQILNNIFSGFCVGK